MRVATGCPLGPEAVGATRRATPYPKQRPPAVARVEGEPSRAASLVARYDTSTPLVGRPAAVVGTVARIQGEVRVNPTFDCACCF